MNNKPKATGSYIKHLVPAWIKIQETIYMMHIEHYFVEQFRSWLFEKMNFRCGTSIEITFFVNLWWKNKKAITTIDNIAFRTIEFMGFKWVIRVPYF